MGDGGEDGAPRCARRRLLVDTSFRPPSTNRGCPSSFRAGAPSHRAWKAARWMRRAKRAATIASRDCASRASAWQARV